MPLHITHAYDAITIEQLGVAIYGGPGLGKTTLGFTADDPLLLDFDRGVHRARNRKDSVGVSKWADVAHMQATDFSGYKTAVVDTAGRALDVLGAYLISDDPKNSTGSGGLSLQGYGALKNAFAQWLNRLKGYGLDVVLISHGTEEKKGDDTLERLDIQGATKNEIHKSVDAMGRLYMQGGVRMLNFSPSDAAFGKNPASLPPLVVPHYEAEPRYLAQVITEIKRVLNEQNAQVTKMRAEIDEARAQFLGLEGAEALTTQAAVLSAAGAKPALKHLLLTTARDKGFVYDKEVKAFVPAPAPAEAPPPVTNGLFGQQLRASAEMAEAPARRAAGGGGRGRRTA